MTRTQYITQSQIHDLILVTETDQKISTYLCDIIQGNQGDGNGTIIQDLIDDLYENADLEDNGFTPLQGVDFINKYLLIP